MSHKSTHLRSSLLTNLREEKWKANARMRSLPCPLFSRACEHFTSYVMLVSMRTFSRVEKLCNSFWVLPHGYDVYSACKAYCPVFGTANTVSASVTDCLHFYIYVCTCAGVALSYYVYQNICSCLLFVALIYSASAYLFPCSHLRSKLP